MLGDNERWHEALLERQILEERMLPMMMCVRVCLLSMCDHCADYQHSVSARHLSLLPHITCQCRCA